MFEISFGPDETIRLHGRLDASNAEKARTTLLAVDQSRTVDFGGLEYISSAGLGALLAAQKKLSAAGHALTLVNVNSHIRDVLRFSGFDRIFTIE